MSSIEHLQSNVSQRTAGNSLSKDKRKELLNPETLAPPVGFTHGVLAEGDKMLFLAGQIGIGRNGHIVAPEDIIGQFEQAIANLETVCHEAGGSLNDIVKLNIYVTDRFAYREHAREIGAIYRKHFGKYYPAMTLVEVKSLWDVEALVEIDGIALLKQKRGQ